MVNLFSVCSDSCSFPTELSQTVAKRGQVIIRTNIVALSPLYLFKVIYRNNFCLKTSTFKFAFIDYENLLPGFANSVQVRIWFIIQNVLCNYI